MTMRIVAVIFNSHPQRVDVTASVVASVNQLGCVYQVENVFTCEEEYLTCMQTIFVPSVMSSDGSHDSRTAYINF